jgi:Holliday junction resolvase RusA-like endonuclease
MKKLSSKVEHFIIKELPYSNNRYMGKSSNFLYRNHKKAWVAKIGGLIPKGVTPYSKCVVVVTYHFECKRKRDYDNFSNKFVLDALVKNGIIVDDNSTLVRPFTFFTFGGGKGTATLEIEIHTVDTLPTREQVLGGVLDGV